MAGFCFMPGQQLDFLGFSAMAALSAGVLLKLLLSAKLFPGKQTDDCKLAYLEEFHGFKNIDVDL